MAKDNYKLDDGFEEVALDDGFEEVPLDSQETTGIVPQSEDISLTSGSTPKGTDLPEDQIGALEAAGANTLVGPTVGGLSAVAGDTIGSLAEGRLPGNLKDTFYEGREDTKKRADLGLEQQPFASVSGMLLESAAMGNLGGALSKAKKLGKVGQVLGKVLPNAETGIRTQRIIDAAKKTKNLDKMYKTYNKLKGASRWARTGKLAVEGAKFGAMSGALRGDAKLMEGELPQALEETATGAAFGAGFGGLLGLGMHGVGKTFDVLKRIKSIYEPYMLGSKGVDLSTEQRKLLTRKATKALHSDLASEFEKTGLGRKEALKLADEVGAELNTLDKVSDAVVTIDEMGLPQTDAEAKAFVSMLRKRLGVSDKMSGVRSKVKNELTKIYQKNLSLDDEAAGRLASQELDRVIKSGGKPSDLIKQGNIVNKELYPNNKFGNITKKVQATVLEDSVDQSGNIIPGKVKVTTKDVTPNVPKVSEGVDSDTGLEYMKILDTNTGKEKVFVAGRPVKQLNPTGSFQEAQEVIQELEPYIRGNKVPTAIQQEALKLKNELKSMIDSKIPKEAEGSYSYFNKKFRDLYQAIDNAGFEKTPQIKGEAYKDQLQALGKILESKTDDLETISKLSRVMDNIRKYSPELYKKHTKDINTLRTLIKYEETPLSDARGAYGKFQALGGKVLDVIFGLSNKLGKGQHAITKGAKAIAPAISSANSKIVAKTPDQIQKIISKIEAKGAEKYKRFLAPLAQIKHSKPRTQQAILFGLMQTPEFRELIKKEKKNDASGEKDD